MNEETSADLDKGIHRLRSAKETCDDVLDRLTRLRPPLLRDYVEIPTPSGIPQYRVRGTQRFTKATHQSGTNGKGHTWSQALASGLVEMAERYACSSRMLLDRGARYCSLSDLGENPFRFEDLLACFHREPATPLDSLQAGTLQMAWHESRMLDGQSAMLPVRLISNALQGTNGMAAGSTPDEALAQGLCELVERHCFTRVRYDLLSTPTVDRRSITSPVLSGLLERFEALGQEVLVKDCSLDTGMPVVGVARRLTDGRVQVNFGVAPWRDEALARALTENSQGEGGHDCLTAAEGSLFFASPSTRPFSAVPSIEGGDLADEVGRVTDRMTRLGWRIFIVEATDSEIGVPAAIIAAPGAKYRDDRKSDRSLATAFIIEALKSEDLDAADRLLSVAVRYEPGKLHDLALRARVRQLRGDFDGALGAAREVVDAVDGRADHEGRRLYDIAVACIISSCGSLGDERGVRDWSLRLMNRS